MTVRTVDLVELIVYNVVARCCIQGQVIKNYSRPHALGRRPGLTDLKEVLKGLHDS